MRRFARILLVVAAMGASTHRSSGQGTAYAPLQVLTNGPGGIIPFHAGQLLEVWGTYRMVAVPEPGFAFHSWERLDVFIKTSWSTNNSGVISTNIEKTVTSKGQFFTSPELTFVVPPVFENVHSDGSTTSSHYGWQANFGPVREVVEPEVYQTDIDATAEERGDRVPNPPRVLPCWATFTFDFGATPPSVTAVISTAVLEGGAPFSLTVRSYSGYQLPNGAYRFSGDYLQDLYPTGSQYGFDWEFSAPTNGRMVWNGTAFWGGGHLWSYSVSDVTLLQQAQLNIARVGPAAIQASWRTNFSEHVLEYAPSFPAAGWSTVTNLVTTNANRLSVLVPTDGAQGFYRLRQP